MSKILIVEDDISIQALLHDFIQEAGHSVVLAADGVEALAKYSEQTFDLVLLDIMLPKIDGYGVCEVIRQKSNVPIIMLTALDNEENQIKGLDLQADDYITKPFSMPVLLRKIAAVLRRSSRQDDVPQTISYKDLTLDLDGYKVYNGQESIDLTPREFEILRELLTHKGRILTRQNLLQTLWKYEFFGEERIIDTHIKNLRKKLGTADYIETIRGVADFNNLLLDNNDFLKLLEAHSDVMAAISPNDDNYDFIMLTLNASLNEIYYEQVEKNTVFSLSGYLEKKEQPMNVEPLPDETSLSAEEQSYNFLFYALYSINYTLPDPAAITVAERDSILKAFRAEMQQYVDGLSVNEIVDSNIKTLLSDKATELANSMSSEKISLSYEISSIEIHNAGTEITQ